jgi:hypothetical protein
MEEVIGIPVGCPMDLSGVVAPPPEEAPGPARASGGRLGRPRGPVESGCCGVWLREEIGCMILPSTSSSSSGAPGALIDARRVVGVGSLHWRYRALPCSDSPPEAVVPVERGGRTKDRAPWGVVEYWFEEVALLADPVAVSVAECDADVGFRRLRELCGPNLLETGGTVHEFIELLIWPLTVVRMIPMHNDAIPYVCTDDVFKAVPLGMRVDYKALLTDVPGEQEIKGWRRRAEVKRKAAPPPRGSVIGAPPSSEDIMWELPEGYDDSDKVGGKMDPLNLLSAMNFGKYLKNQSDFLMRDRRGKSIDPARSLRNPAVVLWIPKDPRYSDPRNG